jgi:hypothetical protein
MIPYLGRFWIMGLRLGQPKIVSIVLSPTNNTQISATYKLTGGATGCLDEQCICIVLEHMLIPHSIDGHFLDHGFTARRAEN